MKISTYCPCCFLYEIEKSDAVLMPFIAKKIFDYDYVDINSNWNLFNFDNGNALMLCKTVKCQSCNFVFSDYRFDDDELFELYKDYREQSYLDLRESFEPGYIKRNYFFDLEVQHKTPIVESFLSEFVTKDSYILDWGGDDGKSTPFKTKNTFVYEITEKPLVDNLKHIDLDNIYKTNFDVIVCSNVLEHVSYPVEFLSPIKKAMSKDTVLYIEVPFEKLMDNEFVDITKKRHWHEHINFFSEISLYKVLEYSGLEIIKFEIYDYSYALNYSNFGKIFMIACKIRQGEQNESL